MNFKCLTDKLIALNEKGIPLPLLRDNHTNEGSFTLTMFFISFNVCIIALIGKVAQLADGIDYQNCLWLLGITGSFYLGRTITGNGKNISISGEENKERKE